MTLFEESPGETIAELQAERSRLLDDLAEHAATMRENQKLFFKLRNGSHLVQSKRAESIVDRTLKDLASIDKAISRRRVTT